MWHAEYNSCITTGIHATKLKYSVIHIHMQHMFKFVFLLQTNFPTTWSTEMKHTVCHKVLYLTKIVLGCRLKQITSEDLWQRTSELIQRRTC